MKPNQANFFSIKREINQLSLDPTAKLGLKLAFFASGLQLIILAISWQRLPPEVPLLYSRAYGETQLVNHWWLWLLPSSSLIIELISIRLAAKTRESAPLWSQMFSWTGTIAGLMALVTLGKIVFLVL